MNPLKILLIGLVLVGAVYLGKAIFCSKNINNTTDNDTFSYVPNMNRAHELYCYHRDLPFDLFAGMETIIYPHDDTRYQFNFISKSDGKPKKATYQLELDGFLSQKKFNEGDSLNLNEYTKFPMTKLRVDPIEDTVLIQTYCY